MTSQADWAGRTGAGSAVRAVTPRADRLRTRTTLEDAGHPDGDRGDRCRPAQREPGRRARGEQPLGTVRRRGGTTGVQQVEADVDHLGVQQQRLVGSLGLRLDRCPTEQLSSPEQRPAARSDQAREDPGAGQAGRGPVVAERLLEEVRSTGVLSGVPRGLPGREVAPGTPVVVHREPGGALLCRGSDREGTPVGSRACPRPRARARPLRPAQGGRAEVPRPAVEVARWQRVRDPAVQTTPLLRRAPATPSSARADGRTRPGRRPPETSPSRSAGSRPARPVPLRRRPGRPRRGRPRRPRPSGAPAGPDP